MEIVGDIVIVILLIIVGYYQNHRISSLETQIKSQKGILESADTFFKLFDLGKLKDYVEILEEKVKAEKEIELKKFREDFEEKLKKEKDASKFISGEFVILLDAFFETFFNLPSEFRNKIIDSMDEGLVKAATKEANKRIGETKAEVRIKALSEAFSQSELRKGIPERNKKGGEPD